MIVEQITLLSNTKEASSQESRKTITCRRGHDTSNPEARDSGRHCKKCNCANRLKSERTPEGRYRKAKRHLRRKIQRNKQKLAMLEREIYE